MPPLLPEIFALLTLTLVLARFGYGWGMAVRNWLYDRGMLVSEAFAVPVIVLGNLRVGGTGKSPHAAYVVEALLSAGHRVALLSRGYGRRTRGFRLVTATETAANVGDEPLEQARRFALAMQQQQLIVAVSEDRRAGIRALLTQPAPPAVVVLDDAFQHRAVRPSLRLLLTELVRPFPADRVLPLGRLREFATGARRADAVIITKCPPAGTRAQAVRGLNLAAIRRAAGEEKPVFFTAYDYGAWVPVGGLGFRVWGLGLDEADLEVPAPYLEVPAPHLEVPAPHAGVSAAARGIESPPPHHPTTPLPHHPTTPLIILTAIDNPAPLYEHLLQAGHTLAARFAFADHHVFTDAELTAVAAAARAHHAPVLTTGKDAARLLTADGALRPALAGVPVYSVPVRVRELPGEASVEGLRALVLRHVREWKGGPIT